MLYSIARCAKANDLDPYDYLRRLFEKLPDVDPEDAEAIDTLLPWRHAEVGAMQTDTQPSAAAA